MRIPHALALTLLLAAGAARADQPPGESPAAPGAAAAPAGTDGATPGIAPSPSAALAAPSAADSRAQRKARFDIHRSVGFATEAMMLGSLGLYIADDVDRFGGGLRSHSFTIPTLALSATAEVGMIINALLAFTAPPRIGGTPTLNVVHQVLMYCAAATNIARFILGVALAGATRENADPGLVNAYRVTAIAAPVLFATGFTLKLF